LSQRKSFSLKVSLTARWRLKHIASGRASCYDFHY
jgi:hypothetical protein